MRVRINNDAGLASPGLNTDPHFGELSMSDGTGITGMATGDVIKSATLVVSGQSFGMTLSPTNGTLTVLRAGLYLVQAEASEISAITAGATCGLDLQKNSAALSPVVNCLSTLPAGGATTASAPYVVNCILSLAVNDTLRVVLTVSAGTPTVKKFRLRAIQLTDAAVTPAT